MPKRNLIWTVAIVVAGMATVLLTRKEPQVDDDRRWAHFRPVLEAYETLRQNAYVLPDEAAVHRGAVRGMVEAMDEFSSYVPPGRMAGFDARLDGRVTCVGLLVDVADGAAEVIGSLPGSPAQEAGIPPGGRLASIDGRDAAGYSAEEIRVLLEGPGVGKVALAVLGPSGKTSLYKLARKPFELETVLGLARSSRGRWEYFLDPGRRIAYLRIKEFASRTPERLQQALRELAGAGGIVLDLRDNPGGRLEAGYFAANLFLREGVIFTQVDRSGARRSFAARSEGTHPDVPMVVLVNGRTASAAEIVAGALKLHGRAVLVGTRTRGKGLVQSMIPLPSDLGQVNLTTGEFFVGLDQRVTRRDGEDAWGVEPHRSIAVTSRQDRQRRLLWARAETVSAGPASRGEEAATAPATAPATRPAGDEAVKDPPLAEAARLLETPQEFQALLAQAAAERAEQDKQRRAREASQPSRAPASRDANGHE